VLEYSLRDGLHHRHESDGQILYGSALHLSAEIRTCGATYAANTGRLEGANASAEPESLMRHLDLPWYCLCGRMARTMVQATIACQEERGLWLLDAVLVPKPGDDAAALALPKHPRASIAAAARVGPLSWTAERPAQSFSPSAPLVRGGA